MITVFCLEEELLEFKELNWQNIVTPINVNKFHQLLTDSQYNAGKIDHLINGFKNSFSLGYQGPTERQDS